MGRNGPNDWEIRRRFFDIYNAVRTAKEPCHIVLSLIQLVRFYQVDSLVMVRFQSLRFFKTQKYYGSVAEDSRSRSPLTSVHLCFFLSIYHLVDAIFKSIWKALPVNQISLLVLFQKVSTNDVCKGAYPVDEETLAKRPDSV